MHTGLAAASSTTKQKARERSWFLDSSRVTLSEWKGIVWWAKTSLDARSLLKQEERREKKKRETIWGSFLGGVGLVTDAWWQMQFSDLSDWCVTAWHSCLLPWIQGSAHLSRDQYRPSPGPVSVINLNIKHVSCHTARERYYPMKRALMNRSRRCDDRGAAGEPVSAATRCACHIHFFISFPTARLSRLKTTWCRWKHVVRVPPFFWQQRVSFLENTWDRTQHWQHLGLAPHSRCVFKDTQLFVM